jgi:CheY-like chemotaxis protein
MSNSGKDAKDERVSGAVSARGRVLFMDDTEIVRKAVVEMLATLGYDVESAVEGTRALELYREAKDRGTPFDVVVLDLNVSRGMDGREALAKLLEIDPEAKIVVSSGLPHDPFVADYARHGARAVIIKPYNSAEINSVIEHVLNS